jgi:hypothetical protein
MRPSFVFWSCDMDDIISWHWCILVHCIITELHNYLLSLFLLGEGEFGQRSIVDHAVEYLGCAHQHPFLFRTPKVIHVCMYFSFIIL